MLLSVVCQLCQCPCNQDSMGGAEVGQLVTKELSPGLWEEVRQAKTWEKRFPHQANDRRYKCSETALSWGGVVLAHDTEPARGTFEREIVPEGWDCSPRREWITWTMEPMVRNVGCSLKGNSSVVLAEKWQDMVPIVKRDASLWKMLKTKEKTKEAEQRSLYLNMAVTSSNLGPKFQMLKEWVRPDVHQAKEPTDVLSHSNTFTFQTELSKELQSSQKNDAKKKHICFNII